MNAEILCVGTEILLGDIVNTNAAYLARELAQCGINCYSQSVVGDNPERLEQAIQSALSRADLLVMTGGLGPTYDDLTKETVARCFNRPLFLHEPSRKRMEAFFACSGHEMTENNVKQAYMPEGAIVFDNDRGTAPGLALEADGKTVIMLPGPPREMTAMFTQQVRPYLLKRSGQTLVSHTLHLFGIGEAALENKLHDLIKDMHNPSVAPYAKEGEVLLRVTALADNTQKAEQMIAPVLEQLRELLADYIYGVDVQTLQNALVQMLQEKKRTIAVAESCTGGLLGKRITEIAGASQVFGCGVCTYSNEMKVQLLNVSEQTLAEHGAVSEETALQMARGVRRLGHADIGVSITGIAGPDGGTKEKPVGLVYVGVSSEALEKVLCLKLSRGYGGDREYIRYAASSHALHLALRTAQLF